jgi:outer membrane protein TolC
LVKSHFSGLASKKSKKNMKKFLKYTAVLFLVGLTFPVWSQSTAKLTIDSCYAMARRNYPVVRQFGLISQSKEYSLDNVSKGYLPQVKIGGHATYQSDVTQPMLNENLPGSLPLFETISKDQYKIYGEIVQPVTSMFTLDNQKELVEVNAQIETKKLEVELYQLKERINQLYFGILLIDLQLEQNGIVKKDIQAGIEKTKAAIDNGTAFRSNLDLLKAEMLKANQQTIELVAGRKAYTDMLSLFIAAPVGVETEIIKPGMPSFSSGIERPELELFEQQKQVYDVGIKNINSGNLPQFSLFFQSGMGRPALNMLSNNFDFFYIGGLRLNWNIAGFYTSGKEKELLEFNKQKIDVQRETFLFNTNLEVKKQLNEVAKIESLIQSDLEIIELRENIKNTAQTQLSNGVITANDYVSYINAVDKARQNLMLHETQLLMVLYNNKVTTGN